MQNSLIEAFWLMVVGMGTVFVVLFLIGSCGRLLIKWVNTFDDVTPLTKLHKIQKPGQISDEKIALLTAVVDEVTGGHGQIDQIRKH